MTSTAQPDEEDIVRHAKSFTAILPHGLAVTDERGHHGPSELSIMVRRVIAAITVGAGARPGIAIWGSHGSDVLAAVLAALACGARVAFLDPASQPPNLNEILDALGIEVLLNATRDAGPVVDDIVTIDVEIVAHDTGPRGGRQEQTSSHGPLTQGSTADDYAILTSGTTGRPKVVLQTFDHLHAHISNYIRYTEIRRDDRILQLASAGWDAGLMDLFACIYTGATLCSFDPRRRSLPEIKRFLQASDPDVIHMTVPLFRLLHTEEGEIYRDPKRVVLGGEVIHRTDLQMFDRTFPDGSIIFNAYGPTECTTALYAKRLRGTPIVDPVWSLPQTVEGVTVSLEADGVDIATSGVTGELIIRSSLMASHLDLTSRAVVALSTARPDGRDGYATGDKAQYDDRGGIVITGRTDSVIKINGQKVSLIDIESELRSAPGVDDTCVIARKLAEGIEIVAAVVPVHDQFDARGLRRYLARRLPGHKMPKRILCVDALPLNRNNKIDRKALEEIAARDADQHQTSHVAQKASSLLREIGAALPDLPLDRDLSFRENGGDSLRAITVLAGLKRSGVELALSDLLSDRSLNDLESQVRDIGPVASLTAPLDPTVVLPNRAFLESLSIPDLDRWSQAVVFDYRGSRDTATLARLVDAVLRRHAALCPGPDEIDVKLLPEALAEDALNDVAARISWRGGAWGAVTIAGRGENRHVAMAFHQFRIDRISWSLLESELEAADQQGLRAVEQWARPTIDYATWIQLYTKSHGRDFAPTHWASLDGAACRDLVPDDVRFPTRTEFAVAPVDLGPCSSHAIACAGGLRRISEAVLASVALGLASLTGSRVQKLDLLSHGRHVEIPGASAHDIVGWFTVIYPMVIAAAPDGDPADVLKAVEAYQVAVADIAHTFGNQFYGTARRGTGTRLRCQASYNFLGEIRFRSTGAFRMNPMSTDRMHGAASHQIEFTGYVRSERLVVIMTYNSSVFSDRQIAGVGRSLDVAYRAIQAGWA